MLRSLVGSEMCIRDREIRLLDLSETERKQFREALFNQAANNGSLENLERFAAWLESQPPFEKVVDVANVAWCNGTFKVANVEKIRSDLMARGENVLLILSAHSRYKFFTSTSNDRTTRQTSGELSLKMLDEQTSTCRSTSSITPKRCNDDLYWMYATVAENRNTIAVTNDLMRDHHRPMRIKYKTFQRWRHCRVMGYETKPELELKPLPRYSKAMQESETCWHIPAKESNLWLSLPHAACL
eukprot:TRINITY_DN31666_c0_g1_i1.p1 TRINITY_DN31666_c0_g1~~TRINITY_DN31666_c0_g1_i1.p1  ORF type:complete len:271 (-),score=30.19 TRINITY_DN31666_c0_g1_i1:326-1051(-)